VRCAFPGVISRSPPSTPRSPLAARERYAALRDMLSAMSRLSTASRSRSS
jgi:hypothetical protein